MPGCGCGSSELSKFPLPNSFKFHGKPKVVCSAESKPWLAMEVPSMGKKRKGARRNAHASRYRHTHEKHTRTYIYAWPCQLTLKDNTDIGVRAQSMTKAKTLIRRLIPLLEMNSLLIFKTNL